jgi:hypothetical protein
MYPTIPAEAVFGAIQIVSYFITVVAILIGLAVTARA